ncbi:ty3-gypsy retrotransposon protein [Cucumis melo var. makuwa]|uniref:Ty3-gypsy retrotransposon protein n=1 Tax=Cucumis melo var. makuwa TaxID=1194695 RepID=A0A5D3E4U5_CUCMM|nr:ty3-gypsy retrotransposon protein [Cucumis melo var. makuwa]TYK30295.1 ty3-gypsy retrotransposon protein [Cucumis melo var. makuwa]
MFLHKRTKKLTCPVGHLNVAFKAIVAREYYMGPVTNIHSKKIILEKEQESRGDQLVKQFVRSLKRNAFEWYTDLELKVIDNWEELEREFLNRFYSTRCIVSLMELGNTKQRKGKPVINYINRRRALSMDRKDKLT